MTVTTSYVSAVRNIVLTGFGMGITIPLYVISVQNAVSYRLLGTVTAATVFMRSIGGTVGLAIFGSVMNNRFASEIGARITPEIRAAVPASQLDSLLHNPQALVSPEAQSQLLEMFGKLGPEGTNLLNDIIQVLRQSLNAAISHVFLYALAIMVLAFIINLFIREIPLRAHHTPDTVPLKNSA
jgi:hypothetical protein